MSKHAIIPHDVSETISSMEALAEVSIEEIDAREENFVICVCRTGIG